MVAPELSIIVPVYNEEARLETSLRKLAKFLRASPSRWELLVVDDGSHDATPRILQRLGRHQEHLRTIRLPRNRGKGAAIRAGLKKARGKFVVFTDCDLSTPPSQIGAAAQWLNRGYDIAIGSRHLPGSRIPVPQPLLRRLVGRVFNLAVKILLGLPYADTQCGFKAFSRRAARLIARSSRVHGFAFDVELLCLAKKLGLRVKEFPIVWSDKAGTTIRLFRHTPKMFGTLLSLQHRFKAMITYHPARALPLILTSCAGAVLGQIFFKKGAMAIQGLPFNLDFVVAMLSSQNIWTGLAFFMCGAVTWIMALARVELSFAFPMLSLNFVFTALYAWLFFGEHLAVNRVAGIALVVMGVLVIATSGKPSEQKEPGRTA